MTSGIYRIDGPGGKVYIGSSVDVEARWYTHRYELRRGTHANKHMRASWNKHGERDFRFSIIEVVSDADRLQDIEQLWLDILFTSLDDHEIYNVARYADSGMRGAKHTYAAREKVSNSRREFCKLPEERSGKRHVFQDRWGERWIIHDDLCDFANDNNLTLQNVARLIRGEIDVCGGWRYAGYYHEIVTDQGWIEEFVDFWLEKHGVWSDFVNFCNRAELPGEST